MNKTILMAALLCCANVSQAAGTSKPISNEDIQQQISLAQEMVVGWLQRAGVQGEVEMRRDSLEKNPNPKNVCAIKLETQSFQAGDNDFVQACAKALDKLKAARPDLASKAEANAPK
ncbi:hypothetical protein [Noviherbaspirillum massiliense]|uniref:hypothetical protein n=1 Tax=Noviherbaspirillum massiliense TaxID=1465823 RepID=UPI00036A54AD|nr:hypothetical protein [Noviherbaspirillum massiliense]